MNANRGLSLFTSRELSNVHATSLRILRDIGVKFPSKPLLDLFRKNGARVDEDSAVVKIPGKLVEKCVRRQVMNNERSLRGRSPTVSDDQVKGWMSLGNLKILVDYRHDSARSGCVRDVLQSIAIANSLPNIERIAGFIEPADVDPKIIDVVLYYLLCLFSSKRFFLVPIYSLASARCMIEMAKAIADDEFQLRNGDLLEYELEPVANLEFSPAHLEIALEFSRQKLKVFVGHYCFMGKDSPADYLSAITLTNANILAAVTAVMLMNPDHFGVDYVFATHGIKSASEPRPLFGAPHQAIFALATRQLADFYGFRRSIANCGLADSCTNDFQSGFERGVTAAISALCGNNGLGLQGIVGADQAVSLDELIIDDAMLSYVNHILKHRSRINSQSIDFDSIKEVGIGGTFLDRMETAQGYREVSWSSPVFSSETYESWAANRAARGSLVDRARRELLSKGYPPTPMLPREKIDRLTSIALRGIAQPDSFRKFLAILATEAPAVGTRE